MAAGVVSTVFTPDPTCVASSNLWLSTSRCVTLPYSTGPDATCTYAYQGELRKTTSQADNCYANFPSTVAYTECPESYSVASIRTFHSVSYDQVETYCCPTAYPYRWDLEPFTALIDNEPVLATLRNQPRCKATSVNVLFSQVVTVTIAREPELVTTTSQWADDDVLFAEAETIRAYVYSAPTPSTCWGNKCPLSYETSPTFPSTITPTPTLQFTAAAECLDPANLWIVTTSCYITAPSSARINSTPDWLVCSMTNFGAPGWSDSSCYLPPAQKVTQGVESVYYDGCPSGYTGVSTTSGPAYDTYRYNVGWFDISYYSTYCCPTEYGFTIAPSYAGQTITTVHDGQSYGVFVYAMPGCYATSVEALSGKDIPMRTTSNTMAWDKRQENSIFPTTTLWDYEHGTMYAQLQGVGHTLLMGTHTCFESCSSWLTYYYPDGTGGSTPSSVAVTTGSDGSEKTGTGSQSDSSVGTTRVLTSGATASGEATSKPATSKAEKVHWTCITQAAGILAVLVLSIT